MSSLGVLRLHDHDGALLWEVDLSSDVSGAPALADIDGDGSIEIIVATSHFLSAIQEDGSLQWRMPTQDFTSGMTVASIFDYEGDGIREVVYADEVCGCLMV